MFNTIKSKILLLAISVLLVLSLILSGSTYLNFKNDKSLMINGCDFVISTFAEQINKEISKLENNAVDLALMGESYAHNNKNKFFAEQIIKKIFIHYEKSLGGGIWFEPYKVHPDRKLDRIYVYHDANGNVLIDKTSDHLNYLEESWYREIKPKLSKTNTVAWSKPYTDNRGSMALMTTVGAGIYDNGELVGISSVDWEISSIIKTVSNMKPTKNSFALFADKNNDYILVSTDKYLKNDKLFGASLKQIPWFLDERKNAQSFSYHGLKYISYSKTLDNGMLLIVNVPEIELFAYIIKHMTYTLIILLLAGCLIAVALYIILKRNINRPIDKLTGMAEKIGSGNLDVEIKLEKPKEFAELADTFNNMVGDIKNYMVNIGKITKEKEKIESELSIARTIQYSVLPKTFYPFMDEFDIYATMDTAKEVGGDFYDFFFITPTQFMFLISDVSGKGIPAALFMMTTKTLIKNLATEGYALKEMFEKINNQIYENNKQGFFVTLFAGIVDITTGKFTYVNCGHNPPLIKRKNQEFEYLKINANLVLGAIPDVDYIVEETYFEKGDMIFLYTDGITEALNYREELYGEQRLKSCLNNYIIKDLPELFTSIRDDVYNYIGEIEQSDDMTMLGFKYNGFEQENYNLEEIIVPAKVENYEQVRSWLSGICEKDNIPQANILKLELVLEELFLNVAQYAYKGKDGEIKLTFKKNFENLVLSIIDSGIPYNPLEKETPDITLSAEEREVGGLGIFMVKNTVDAMTYNYEDNQNIVTVTLKVE